jgi:hypothetical protein
MLLDDARVRHGVSPIQAIDPARPALRDVLVVTLAAAVRYEAEGIVVLAREPKP